MSCRQGITSRNNLIRQQKVFGKVYLIRHVTRGTFITLDIHASMFGDMMHIQGELDYSGMFKPCPLHLHRCAGGNHGSLWQTLLP